MARFHKNSTPKLSDALIIDITECIKQRMTIETSVAMCGLSKDTFYRWLREARKPNANPMTVKLSDAVRQAQAEVEVRCLEIINAHAQGVSAVYEQEVVREKDGSIARDNEGKPIMQLAKDAKGNPIIRYKEIKPDWRASAWILSRRYPERWGPNSKQSSIEEMLNEIVTPKIGIDKVKISEEDIWVAIQKAKNLKYDPVL